MINKKILPVVVILLVVLFASSVQKVHAQTSCSLADINEDGTVDLSDYSILVQNFLKPSTTRADINSDGIVDLTDYSLLTRSFLQTCSQTSPTPQTSSPTPITGAGHYYVATTGNDSAAGTAAAPFKTIQKAVLATKTDTTAGGTIHIMPGTYREAVLLDGVSGTQTNQLTIKAENGPETVFINGSESSKDSRLTWSKSTGGAQFPSVAQSHIYYADISAWNGTPELAVKNDSSITRLPKAHEPDWEVTTEWKYHENWWKADSGTTNSLTDATNDSGYPQASQLAGNLKSVNGFNTSFLTGGKLFFKDTNDGHDFYNANITAHDAATGKITIDQNINYYSGEPAAGQYTKYFIEGKSQLLDQEGEWYFDASSKRLYIWPPQDVSPSSLNLEFAVRPTVISIHKSSYVTIKDLTLQFSNYNYGKSNGTEGAIRFYGYSNENTDHITFDHLNIRHNGVGLRLYQSNGSATSAGTLSYVTLKNSKIEHSDGYAMMVWHWPVPAPNPFIHHLFIENNEFGYMGFRGTGAGLFMQHPEKIVFVNNYLHHSGHNAIEIQQGKGSGNSLFYIANNLSENNCYNGIDCGAFKIYHADGGTGLNNIVVTHNIFRGTKGWAYASEAQNNYVNPVGKGYGGSGYYTDVGKSSTPDQGCAISVFRNIIYNNTNSGVQLTRSRDQCIMNNVLAQNTSGIAMNNYAPTTDGSFNNKVRGNIIMYNDASTDSSQPDARGIVSRINKADESKLEVNGNIYKMTGTNAFDMFKQDLEYTNVGTWKTITDIRNNTPWEDAGRDTNTGNFTITNQQQFDISTIETIFGVNSVPVPPEVQTVINRLQTEFGVTITNSSTVGRLNTTF